MTSVLREPAMTACSPSTYRQVMRTHAAGVSVITTYRHGPVGFCATSLSSVSVDPAVVAFSVNRRTASGRAWAQVTYGIVHLLNADQSGLASSFARPGFGSDSGQAPWRFGPYGQPLLDRAAAWLVVRRRALIPVGEQLLVLCDVVQAEAAPGPGPLVHHAGGYHGLCGVAPVDVG